MLILQTPTELEKAYVELMDLPQYQGYTPLNFYGVAYDAMWAIAYGLHKVDLWAREGKRDEECDGFPGELVTLDKFNYTNIRMGCYLRKGVEKVNFIGITVSQLLELCASCPCLMITIVITAGTSRVSARGQ